MRRKSCTEGQWGSTYILKTLWWRSDHLNIALMVTGYTANFSRGKGKTNKSIRDKQERGFTWSDIMNFIPMPSNKTDCRTIFCIRPLDLTWGTYRAPAIVHSSITGIKWSVKTDTCNVTCQPVFINHHKEFIPYNLVVEIINFKKMR